MAVWECMLHMYVTYMPVLPGHCHGGDHVGAAGISEAFLRSPSALQALGGAIAPLLSSINPSTLGNTSGTAAAGPQPPCRAPSQVSALPIPPTGWYPPFPAIPYPYSFPYIHPSQGVSQYGAIHRSDQGSSSRQKSSLPGNPGSASNCPHRQGGLLASSSRSFREPTGEEDWEYLVDPNLSMEERRSLEAESEDNTSDNEGDFQEENAELSEELAELLTMALKQPIKPEMRKRLLERYPRLTASGTAPPNLDKAIRTLVQKRKNILSHDRFLAKLQRFASDALGPLTYLLSELQAGKDVHKDVAISALQAAICLSGNAFASLSVERRRYVLQQLNHQLVPLAEEEYELSGKLFGDDFGERAKARMDAIRSLSRSSSVFFQLGDPPVRNKFRQGLGGRGKGPANRFTPYRPKGGRWGKPGSQSQADKK